MKVYDSTDEVRDELNKIWGPGDNHVSYGTLLFNVTFYANVRKVWRRCVVGPVDGALATQLLCADGHSFSVEEVQRVVVGDIKYAAYPLFYPGLEIW